MLRNTLTKKLRIWSHLLKKSLMENFIFVQCLLLRCYLICRCVFRKLSNIYDGFFCEDSQGIKSFKCFRVKDQSYVLQRLKYSFFFFLIHRLFLSVSPFSDYDITDINMFFRTSLEYKKTDFPKFHQYFCYKKVSWKIGGDKETAY